MLKLIKFWASWCGPCKQLNPIVEKIEQEYSPKGLIVEKINIDENREMAEKYQVMSIPTLILFKDDQIMDQMVGLVPEARIREMIDKYIANKH